LLDGLRHVDHTLLTFLRKQRQELHPYLASASRHSGEKPVLLQPLAACQGRTVLALRAHQEIFEHEPTFTSVKPRIAANTCQFVRIGCGCPFYPDYFVVSTAVGTGEGRVLRFAYFVRSHLPPLPMSVAFACALSSFYVLPIGHLPPFNDPAIVCVIF
jgi:hypothetical protein